MCNATDQSYMYNYNNIIMVDGQDLSLGTFLIFHIIFEAAS